MPPRTVTHNHARPVDHAPRPYNLELINDKKAEFGHHWIRKITNTTTMDMTWLSGLAEVKPIQERPGVSRPPQAEPKPDPAFKTDKKNKRAKRAKKAKKAKKGGKKKSGRKNKKGKQAGKEAEKAGKKPGKSRPGKKKGKKRGKKKMGQRDEL